jgi:hypothetical protein
MPNDVYTLETAQDVVAWSSLRSLARKARKDSRLLVMGHGLWVKTYHL